MLPTELRLCNFQQFNTFPKRQILDSSRLREFADDNSKFDENRGKFSNRFENARGKGDISHYEQFLLFPRVYKKLQTRKEKELGRKR